MMFQLSAACGCSVGKVRKNNEDNFSLNGRSLAANNSGLKVAVTAKYLLDTEKCFAVFDGMGGEEAGEIASFTAAQTLKKSLSALQEYVQSPSAFLKQACEGMNLAVCQEMDKLPFGRMGTTAAMLYFTTDEVYSCNLGDSRIYRLRDQEFMQLSTDDSEHQPDHLLHKKAPLTQFLGVYPDELRLVPHIAKGNLQRDDIYLICSDGLTDMLTNIEICTCLKQHASMKQGVEHLIGEALNKGGKDNVTVLLIKVI